MSRKIFEKVKILICIVVKKSNRLIYTYQAKTVHRVDFLEREVKKSSFIPCSFNLSVATVFNLCLVNS